MEDIEQHHKEFERIAVKYGLKNPERADEIAEYLLKEEKINSNEFARVFEMDEEDARIFIGFIEKSIHWKKKTSI